MNSWYKGAVRPLKRIPSFANILEMIVNEDKGKCISCLHMLGKHAPEHKNKLSQMIYFFSLYLFRKINYSDFLVKIRYCVRCIVYFIMKMKYFLLEDSRVF